MKKIISLCLVAVLLLSASQVFAASRPSSWARNEVNAAISEGIVPETIQTDYRAAITRQEFCEMVVLVYTKLGGADIEVPASPFSDTDNASVSKASALGIVLGVGEGFFAPDSNITRQEICAMLTRTVKKAKPGLVIPENLPNTFPDIDTISDWALFDVKFVNILEVMLGDEENRINPHNNTTREQAILLSHRLVSAFGTEITSFLETLGFYTSGNTPVNMLNGAFAISYTNGPLYLSDNTGVYTLTPEGVRGYITNEEATAIFMQGAESFYIKKSDGLLYNAQGTALCNIKADKFTVAGDYIYFTSPSSDGIYRIPSAGGSAELLINGKTAMPVSSGKYIYYTTSEGIFKYDTILKTTDKVYDGSVFAFTVDNSRMYFKDSEGFLVTAKNDGTEVKRITKTPIDVYCIYGSEGIAYTKADGVFKTDLGGKFNIRLNEGTFTQMNSYNNYIFLKDSDGNIYRISSNALDFAKLN